MGKWHRSAQLINVLGIGGEEYIEKYAGETIGNISYITNARMLMRLFRFLGLVRRKALGKYYNIRYGFWRNLSAATPLAILFFLVGIAFSFISGNLYTATVFFIAGFFYTGIFFLRKWLLRFFGEHYAEQLFLEYLK